MLFYAAQLYHAHFKESAVTLKKRIVYPILMSLLAVALLTWGTLLAFDELHISYSEEEVQNRLNPHFPRVVDLKKSKLKSMRLLQEVEIKKVIVSFGKNEMEAAIEITGQHPKPFELTGHARGTLEFRDDALYFHLNPATLHPDHLVVDKVDLTRLSQRAANMEKFQDTIVGAFERNPIYRVKSDVKGFLLSSLMKSVYIEDGKLVAVVSVVQFTYKMMVIALFVILVLVALFFMLRYPEVLTGVFEIMHAMLLPLAILGSCGS